MDLWIKINRSLATKKMQTEGKDHPKGVKKIAKELDKAVAMHKSQAKRLRKAGISEEISRRKKPSAIRKKKTLDAALERLKKKRESIKEGDARADKLAQAVRSGITTGTVPSLKAKKLDKIIKKVRELPEMVSKLKDSDRRTPGTTINIKATTVKDNQLAKREPDKGSALATRGTKNTEVKDKRKPAPYSSGERKEKKQFKGPSKERIGKIAKGIHSGIKKAGSALQQGYGTSSWNKPM